MLTGAYSQKFKDLEQDRLARSSSSDSLNHSQQLAARDKVRQLSLETNRRRRAAELKRRLEAQKEAKRRQEVLEERRKRQQEATQRYQRGQRVSPKTEPRVTSGKAYSDSRLHDGVNIARGYSQTATYAGNHSNRAPALEEALRMVGVNTAPASSTIYRGGEYAGETDYTTDYREGYNEKGVAFNHENYVSEVPLRRPIVDTNGNTVSENKGHHYHGYATTATSTYNSNVNRDATSAQFQQTLHEKQKQLMEQQQAALNEFNQAVLNETLPSQEEDLQLRRSSSLSSLDSLEEERQKKPVGYDGRRQQPGPSAYKPVHASKTETVGGAIQTGTAYGNNYARPNKVESGPSAISDNRLFTSQASSEQPHIYPARPQRGLNNGELLVEETSETDVVSEGINSKPTLLQQANELHSQLPSYGLFSPRTSHAWTTLATTETPPSHNNDASHSPIRYTTEPVSVHAGHRPFSARTTATAVSTYPARVPEPSADHHYARQQEPEQFVSNRTISMSKYSGGNHDDFNYTRSKYGIVGNTYQAVDFQSTDGPTQTSHHPQEKLDNALETPEKTVKSILKRCQVYDSTPQKVKLGDMRVKDSLEISRATQAAKADRKSVRWTDLKYTGVDEVRSEVFKMEKEHKVSSESAKPERSSSAGTRQNDAGRGQIKSDRQSASAGPPPKGPSKLQWKTHNASKPPPGRYSTSGKKAESVKPETVSRVSGKVIIHQQESANKFTPSTAEDGRLYKNGIRLDKTPTDDEINWLWDKVRTCLNTQEQGTSGPGSDTSNRQPASVSKQCIDGNRLTANLRVPAQGHVTAPHEHPLTNQKKYNTYPRFRTNSDSGTASLRKTALLHQRRQHNTVGNLRPGYQGRSNQHYAGPVPGLQPSPPSSGGHYQPSPTVGNQGPVRTVGGMPNGQNKEVSDSLLAFQQAECLAAQENLSESEIAAAMEHQKSQAFIQKAPTALSLEERRILESLDKLNAQLRTVTSDTDTAIQPYKMQPKPPAQGAGFRSQHPISARQRAIADPNLAHRTRTVSADRSNDRINYYH